MKGTLIRSIPKAVAAKDTGDKTATTAWTSAKVPNLVPVDIRTLQALYDHLKRKRDNIRNVRGNRDLFAADAIENLVLAHHACNCRKRDFLPAVPHLEHWAARLLGQNHSALIQVSDHAGWETRRDQTIGVAAAIYLGLPDEAPLWIRGNDTFKPLDRPRALEALSSL
jgi:hypothetical protein